MVTETPAERPLPRLPGRVRPEHSSKTLIRTDAIAFLVDGSVIHRSFGGWAVVAVARREAADRVGIGPDDWNDAFNFRRGTARLDGEFLVGRFFGTAKNSSPCQMELTALLGALEWHCSQNKLGSLKPVFFSDWGTGLYLLRTLHTQESEPQKTNQRRVKNRGLLKRLLQLNETASGQFLLADKNDPFHREAHCLARTAAAACYRPQWLAELDSQGLLANFL